MTVEGRWELRIVLVAGPPEIVKVESRDDGLSLMRQYKELLSNNRPIELDEERLVNARGVVMIRLESTAGSAHDGVRLR